MTRRNRRDSGRRPGPAPGGIAGKQLIALSDGDWMVQRVSGSAATKRYLCPGCNQHVAPGTPHIVAWPDSWNTGVDDRRHWHTPCWQSRVARSGPQ